MPEITADVGEGGAANKVHDVALVQAMLRVVKNAKGTAYLAKNYTGGYDAHTKAAIIAFQTDSKLVTSAKAAPGAAPPAAKAGVVGRGGVTFRKLVKSLPTAYAGMRIIQNTKTVYLDGSAAAMRASQAKIQGAKRMQPTFQAKVVKLVNQMYDNHKIVLQVTRSGLSRTFADQAALNPTKAASPGQSNHNYGRAVDIGFQGLKWLQGNGTIKPDNHWLSALQGSSASKANAFWNCRDAIALNQLGLFRLQKERIHLQSYKQAPSQSVRSLAALLNAVGKMKWQAAGSGYKCDLGYGAAKVPVGNARQIWAGKAGVTKALIAQARSSVAKAKKVTAAQVKQTEVDDKRKALKKDFETADTNWAKWKPVP